MWTDQTSLKSLLAAGAQGRKLMRLFRYAERLGQYRYVVEYRFETKNHFADILSCYVADVSEKQPETSKNAAESFAQISTIFGYVAFFAIKQNALREETATDKTIQTVFRLCIENWLNRCRLSEKLAPFYAVRKKLAH